MIRRYFKALVLLLICSVQIVMAGNNISALSEETCQTMVQAGGMSIDAPVACSRLLQVEFNYIDFDGVFHDDGVMVVMDAIAPYIASIFSELYKLQFPIHKARPISDYDGEDKRSMAANNSSAFNYRAITGKKLLSLHAYGLAIDINPLQNPFIELSKSGIATFSPSAGIKYANRMSYRLDKKQPKGFAEDIIAIFADNGLLYWGGFWDTPIDYQHFQVSRSMANLMSVMSSDDAKQFFSQTVNWYRSCKAYYPLAYSQHRGNDYLYYLQSKLNNKSLSTLYKQSPQKIQLVIQSPFKRSAMCVKS